MTMTVNGATRRREIVDDDFPAGGGGSTPARTNTTPAPASSAQAQHDAALAAAVRNANPKPSGDGILYVGLNQGSAPTELSALQAASGGQVTAVLSHAGGKVDTKFGDFDLQKPGEVARFCEGMVEHYGLAAAQGEALEKLLGSVEEEGKDEVARMALYFARAESGGTPMPSRLVLSGHSGSDVMFGQTPGSLATGKRVAGFTFEQIRQLGEIMPRAAAQIEDIHFAGCNTYHQVGEDGASWRKAFPNLQTMWGYSGASETAPVNDLRAWERRSRGHADNFAPGSLDAHWRPEGHVVGWSRKSEFVNGERQSLAEARALRDAANAHFQEYLSGDRTVRSHTESQPFDDYQAFNNVAVRSDVSSAEVLEARTRAPVMFRVRFYQESVRGHFQEAHGAEIAGAFQALGLREPDFSKLTRKEAMDRVDEFRKAAGTPPRADVAAASRLLDGLASLDPNVIREEWVSR